MIRKPITLSVSAFLFVFFCSTASAEPLTFEDSQGRTHNFQELPERFAACSSFSLETLMALGIEPVVRFDVPPVYPPAAEGIPIVARSHATGPDVEMLIAVRPDVVLLHDVFRSYADSVQETIGVPVVLHDVDSLDDARKYIGLLGQLTGKTEKANALLSDFESTLAWIGEQSKPENPPKAISLYGTNDAWYAHRENAFMGDLLRVLGANNIASDAEAHDRYRSLAPIDIEKVVANDPDVIFIMPYNGADPGVVEEFMAHPAFKALRAVKEGRAHRLDGPIYASHAGPRAGVALRTLYGYLYPDSTQPPNPNEKSE